MWIKANLAQLWFVDALQEAHAGEGRHALRREIVFAVCFAETCLHEFVRDAALNRNYAALPNYFPSRARRGIRERWKNVLKTLHQNGRLKAVPDFDLDPSWSQFLKLVDCRDGLVHAKASRPATPTQTDKEKPLPSPEDLDGLPAGWAVKIVIELVRSLHQQAGIPAQAWLVEQ